MGTRKECLTYVDPEKIRISTGVQKGLALKRLDHKIGWGKKACRMGGGGTEHRTYTELCEKKQASQEIPRKLLESTFG